MRPDAARNRARIVDAASVLVAAHGPDAGMDEIARLAGVAVGTLYRHYPTKSDLVAAVIEARTRQLADTTEQALARLRAGDDPWTTTSMLIREVAQQHITDQALKAASAALGSPVSMDPQAYDPDSSVGRAVAAITALLQAAQDAGQVQSGITVLDLAALLAGVPGPSAQPALRERYLDIMLAGLRRYDDAICSDTTR